jgi:histidine triad (HIT) family protein
MRDAWERLPKKGGNMEDCIFCKLANGEIPTDMVYEDDRIACFRDADPQAPVHVLMVPKRHIPSLDDLTEEDSDLLGYMMIKIKDIAAGEGLENGYRAVINCGEDGQQTVKHLHIHILGKRKMTWPPG